jgi:hypothetical protein
MPMNGAVKKLEFGPLGVFAQRLCEGRQVDFTGGRSFAVAWQDNHGRSGG